jgi:hypothetical protein
VSATYIVSIGGLIVVFASTMVIATDPLPVTQTAIGRCHAVNKAQKRTQARADSSESALHHQFGPPISKPLYAVWMGDDCWCRRCLSPDSRDEAIRNDLQSRGPRVQAAALPSYPQRDGVHRSHWGLRTMLRADREAQRWFRSDVSELRGSAIPGDRAVLRLGVPAGVSRRLASLVGWRLPRLPSPKARPWEPRPLYRPDGPDTQVRD